MCKISYLEKMIHSNDIIYIDTSSVMFDDWFAEFIDNARPLLIEYQKKITIIYSVYKELEKKSKSSDLIKSQKAINSMSIINDNLDLFDILLNSEISENFADFCLLNQLIVNRRNCRQLLITNDRTLANDAIDFNDILSVDGKYIMVCRLSFGYLKSSDYNTQEKVFDRITENQEVQYVEKIQYVEKEKSMFEKYFIPGLTYSLGIVTGIGGTFMYVKCKC